STAELQSALNAAEKVLVAVYMIPVAGRAVRKDGTTGVNSISMPESTAALLQTILQAKRSKTVVVSFGSPYVAADFPEIESYICPYSKLITSDMAAAKALFGEIPFHGRLPVTIPGFAQRGAGMDRPSRLATRLK